MTVRLDLPPIEVTHKTWNTKTNRMEIWSAKSGSWGMERIEGPGTRWLLIDIPTQFTVIWGLPSLKACLEAVASGEAPKELDRLLTKNSTGV